MFYFPRFTVPFHQPAKTNAVWHKSYVEYDYNHQYKYKPVTLDLLDYLQTHSLVVELWGKQGKHVLLILTFSQGLLSQTQRPLHSKYNENLYLTNNCKVSDWKDFFVPFMFLRLWVVLLVFPFLCYLHTTSKWLGISYLCTISCHSQYHVLVKRVHK